MVDKSIMINFIRDFEIVPKIVKNLMNHENSMYESESMLQKNQQHQIQS
eukprot:UN24854